MSKKYDGLPPWFYLDADLWQPPGPQKLDWTARKVAIYLRDAAGSGLKKVKDKLVPTKDLPVAYRNIHEICQVLDLSRWQVLRAVNKLREWPSIDAPFITDWKKGDCTKKDKFTLRRLDGSKWVKVRRSRWNSKTLTDSHKDVLFFIGSQFQTKSHGHAIYRCNLYGRVLPSVIRYCGIPGKNKDRKKNAGKIVKELLEWGYLKTTREHSGTAPKHVMEKLRKLTQISDTTNPSTPKASNTEFNQSEGDKGTADAPIGDRERVVGNPATCSREPSNMQSGTQLACSQEPTLLEDLESVDSLLDSSSQRLNDSAAYGVGGDKSPNKEAETSIEETEMEEAPLEETVIRLPDELADAFFTDDDPEEHEPVKEELWPLASSKTASTIREVEEECFIEKSTRSARSVLNDLEELIHRERLVASDLIAALQSSDFEGLHRSWGLLMSKKFKDRFTRRVTEVRDARLAQDRQTEEQRSRIKESLCSSNVDVRKKAIALATSWFPETAVGLLTYCMIHDADRDCAIAAMQRIVPRLSTTKPKWRDQIKGFAACRLRQETDPEVQEWLELVARS